MTDAVIHGVVAVSLGGAGLGEGFKSVFGIPCQGFSTCTRLCGESALKVITKAAVYCACGAANTHLCQAVGVDQVTIVTGGAACCA